MSGGARGRPDRLCVVALAVALAPGCVIPLGPEFEGDPNVPPFLVSATPPVGSVVTKVKDVTLQFNVVVEDPNDADPLFARWLIDYPPRDSAITRLGDDTDLGAGAPGKSNRRTINFQPSCSIHLIASGIKPHRLMLVVSDRPFPRDPDDEAPLDVSQPDTHTLKVVWTFDMECL